MTLPGKGDAVTITMGRLKNVRGNVAQIINDDMVLVDVWVPARLAVRTSELRTMRQKRAEDA